ncbi:MAG: response regulator transcription factor [Ignavibacteria bacterium]|nr:response regulator transcription factor [Ignavibacteria bacterium]MBT8381036.1 response regulator transcription factor [Ignavibacteria bacterium]MBT8393039.1 response regulator transcription factor [Ignavibacteria bacterium]NNJ52014.1 response regulator transcription factor [Ignavibacteriaceae bacterium]NNL20502.1 response regulator transcription factor [Ignavibacteriaceae bacterium]
MEILIAEDEHQIADPLRKHFLEEGHHAMVASDGQQALELLAKVQFDVIILDWKMPKVSGFEVCKKIRENGDQTPILLLTALTDVSNKIDALNAGADDYITKPFSFDELYARVKAIKRRFNVEREVLEYDNITLNLIKRSVELHSGNAINLTEKEFDLLKYFILNKGSILDKEQLCKNVWGLGFTPKTNICEVTVKNLRKKLEEISGKKYINTIYGEGYILIDD